MLAAAVTVLAGTTVGSAAAREPSVRPGSVVVAEARGFVPFATVSERVDAGRTVRHRRADSRGTVIGRVRAPRAVGRHRVVFVGRGAGARVRPTPSPVGGPGDVQALRAEVPRVIVYRFRVVTRPGGAGLADAGAGREDTAAGQGSEVPLAATGADLRFPLVGGALLLVIGVALTATSGRHARESVTSAP